jgi:UDP-N-acetylmuramate--alanine ligase
MHVFFSGIGGAGIGPLALIAKQAGYEVSGSDAKDSAYIQYLRSKGINDIHIGQTAEQIKEVQAAHPIDWFVYSSALPLTDPKHPELTFCDEAGIKKSKRDEFLSQLIVDKDLKLIAVAGTHGKTTTTAMLIWLAQQLGIKASWSVGAKISFGDMGHFDPEGQYFIYEADEFDRNFLSFYPQLSLITGLDWDHPDIYPTRHSYLDAFREFLDQSQRSVLWHTDAEMLGLDQSDNFLILDQQAAEIDQRLSLPGRVNRWDAWLAAKALAQLPDFPFEKSLEVLNQFPGLSRRFENIAPNVYSDYAHTPPKIRGALQLAQEIAGNNVVVVYEGLHNTRQHFIKDQLADLFDSIKQLYIVPSYLAREDKDLELLTPDKILNMLSISTKSHAAAAGLNDELAENIKQHAGQGDLVLCLSAGGSGSLDEWLRKEFIK